jgi:2-hydroxychromene-2-carboxylate isomerase
MSVKTAIVSRAASYWTSEAALLKRRRDAERARKQAGEPHVVDLFIDPDDPYSHLLLQLMPAFAAHYAVEVKPWLVSPPDEAAAPERALLADWSRRDAAMLAARAGLSVDAVPLPAGLVAGDQAAIAAGDARREACGHYLGGVLHYGGETYWGIDRLHYLEERLTALGLRRDEGTASLYPPPPDMASSALSTPLMSSAVETPSGKRVWTSLDMSRNTKAPTIHYYLSFRSPYTWIAAPRVKALAEAHGAKLDLRFVLPMVMRSLPVPPAKRRYITLDTAREARRLGIPFGKVADPVGRPVERGYSLLPWARDQGRGTDYVIAFLRAVFSQGIDAGSDTGMKRIVTAAGLDWKQARTIIDNDEWRCEAEVNRAEMLDLGLWGVPSFRVDDFAVWGQDRLSMVDAALRQSEPPRHGEGDRA